MTMNRAEDAFVEEAPAEEQPSERGTQSSVGQGLTRAELIEELNAHYRATQGLITPVQQRLAQLSSLESRFNEVLDETRENKALLREFFHSTDPETAERAGAKIAAELKASGDARALAALKEEQAKRESEQRPEIDAIKADAEWGTQYSAIMRYASKSKVPWTPQLQAYLTTAVLRGPSTANDPYGLQKWAEDAETYIDNLAEDGTPRRRISQPPTSRTTGTAAPTPDDLWNAYGRGEVAWSPQVQAAGKALGLL